MVLAIVIIFLQQRSVMAVEAQVEERAPPSSTKKRSWEALKPPLAEWILDAVASMGFKHTTPVQAATIPLFMGHKDVVVEAVTGSGKTLAYLIPIIEQLLRVEEKIKKHHVGAIILSPTRELATQIHGVLLSLLAFHAPSAALIDTIQEESRDNVETISQSNSNAIVPQLLVGGDTTTSNDLSSFLEKSPNVLVSTPGRLLSLLSSPHVHCPSSSFEVLVLDEADRLLDLGFKDELQKILGRLPKQRRTGLFSASVSEAVDQVVRVGLRNPVKIAVKVKSHATGEVAESRTPASLEMHYIVCAASHRLPTIAKLLSGLKSTPGKTMIYLSSCAAVDYMQHVLPCLLSPVFCIVPLHGKHPPSVRTKNFGIFSSANRPSILLTTDVAARGLDIPQVDLVLQNDPPTDPKVFLHRCGRAGRAGRRGMSILFLLPGREEDYVRFLAVRKTPVSLVEQPDTNITPTQAEDAASKIRQVVTQDRALHDKAQRGFVSWVRAYSKHQTSSIFRVEDIDWADQGKAWGLLKLPKMPELKGWEGDKSLGVLMDWASFPYRDKKREDARRMNEKARRIEKAEMEEADISGRGSDPRKAGRNTKRPWSEKLGAKDEREVRRDKKQKKRDHERWDNMTPEERKKQAELENMIAQVKKQNEEERCEDFHGFDD